MNGNTSAHQRPRSLGTAAVRRVVPVQKVIAALAFWAAIVLPAIYLPLFFAGIDTPDGLMAFLVLVAGHVTALVAGRHHRATVAD